MGGWQPVLADEVDPPGQLGPRQAGGGCLGTQRPLGLGGGRRERALYGRIRGRYKWIHITINVASPTLTVLTGKAPV